MNYKFATLAIATAIAVSGGTAYAQQIHQSGRDSVYAVPGTPSSDVGTVSFENRYGRDSIYARQPSEPSAPMSATAARAQQSGRDGAYAAPLGPDSAHQDSTAIGTKAPRT